MEWRTPRTNVSGVCRRFPAARFAEVSLAQTQVAVGGDRRCPRWMNPGCWPSFRRKMRKVVYVTDPEGNLGYFQQCLARSNGAYVEDGEIVLQKDWVLVVRARLLRIQFSFPLASVVR